MTASAQPNRPAEPLSRREVLTYGIGASLALLLAGSCGGIAWFVQRQRIVDDPASGLFRLNLADLPLPNADPLFVREAQAYVSHTDSGLIALIGACPFDQMLVRWNQTNDRFECPACGSKFQLDGTYLKGDAAQDLDQAALIVTSDDFIIDVKAVIPGTPRPLLPPA